MLREITIAELFRETAARQTDDKAVIYEGTAYTWRELDVLSDVLANRLEELGVRSGDRVGLWGQNSAAWIVTFLALQKLGAVAALLNTAYLRRELVQVMRIGDLNWLCYGETSALENEANLVPSVLRQLNTAVHGAFDMREKTLQLKKMLQECPVPAQKTRPRPDPHSVSCLLYTSGSTMEPKCVQHSHHSLVNNAIITTGRTGMNAEDRLCLSQPLFHMFGFTAGFLASIYTGTPMYVLSRFGSEDILRCVAENRCTVLNGVPTNFLRILSNPVFSRYCTESLRVSMVGGAPITEQQVRYIREAFPTATLMSNYGLTEGCCLTNSEYGDSEHIVANTVGRPYPETELAIWDREDGRFLPVGEQGEIVMRGYSRMLGYYKPENGEQPIDEDGWLHTEDLGVLDANGRLSIVGRIKEIIIRGGEDITPVEIRREIQRYEPIRSAFVLGAPHPVLGEEVVACITLDCPEYYSEKELRSILKTRLAPYKIPAFILVYDELPLRPNGKIDRLALKEDACAKVRLLHAGDERYEVTPQPRC